MKRKAVALVLAGLMAAGTVSVSVQAGTDEKGAPTVDAGSWDGEISEIVMTYLDMATPTDLQKVEDAVNAITEPDIGVHVTFKEYPIFTAATQYPLDVTAGEQIDLMMVPFVDVKQFAEQGLIDPLDDLLAENAPYISWVLENEGYPLLDGTLYEDEHYGVAPVMYYYGTGGNILVPNEYLEKAGVTIEEGKVYSLEELTEVYAALKEAYPDCYPVGTIINNSVSGASTPTFFGVVMDPLGATASSGALMSYDSKEIVNFYKTEEYKTYLSYCDKWQKAGYIHPDATTVDGTANELIKSGVLLSENMTSQPVMKSDLESGIGKECTQILTSEPYYTAQSGAGTFWAVPITAEEPEAAVRFLDYTYSNHDLHNLILWGIVDEHIKVVDADNYLIDFVDGLDGNSSPYFNTFGLYGDRRYEYVWNLNNSKEANQAYTEAAMKNSFSDIGYAYDSSRMATAVSNVNAVCAQYIPTLECGLADDWEAYYNEFIEALDNAGINDIIADNQACFDEWLASQE